MQRFVPKTPFVLLIAFVLVSLCLGVATSALAQCQLVGPKGNQTLTLDGKPFLILGGELGNSSVSSTEDINRHLEKLHRMGLNTVLAPVYWELMEPTEGQFDFSLTDSLLASAQRNNLRVVLLWFGAWKNSMSCYAPAWFKTDTQRFPRAQTAKGKSMEIASAFSPNVFETDRKALEALVLHLALRDTLHTVAMLQIENEIGMLEDARDHSPLANKAYDKGVPRKLTAFLASKSPDQLHPLLAQRWAQNGSKTRGTWVQLFGSNGKADLLTDEIFQAWYHADYVGRLAHMVRKHTTMPLYVNAALNSRGRKPGEYPSAGPLAHLIDVWRAAAPDIDFISPDIYDKGFDAWAEQYATLGNPLFIPEMRLSDNNGAQALYAFGELHALGVSPFSIENGAVGGKLTKTYATLAPLMPFLTQMRDSTRGVLFNQEIQTDGWRDEQAALDIKLSHYFTLPWDPRATDGSTWPDAGAILVKMGPREFLLIGTGVVLNFTSVAESQASALDFVVSRKLGEDGFVLANDNNEVSDGQANPEAQSSQSSQSSQPNKVEPADWTKVRRIGILSVDEVEVDTNGTFRRIRRLNGDEDHQGRHVRIGVDDVKVLHVKLYDY